MEGDELLKCNVCLSGFDRNFHKPLLLPSCGHTFCRFCLDTLYKQSKKSCPECRKQDALASVELLPTNFSLLALAESMTQSDPDLSTRPKSHKNDGSPTRDTDFHSEVSEALSTTRPTRAPVHPVASPRNLVNLGARPRLNHPGRACQSQLSRKHKAQHPPPAFMQQATNLNSHQQATCGDGQNLDQPDFCNDEKEAVRLQEELDFQMAIHLTFCKDANHKHDDPDCFPNCWQFPADEELSAAIHQTF
ncbi:uncharacterized protein LOC125036727 [Penaeus chinensis]|uniref:uncharacterized protein LOC125036727 n=1 Tax=Penaeus chinensis TaxID=139456 RepID=UPI001FB63D0F|nr:uncharacterized protein LOC125036727 [Penaeus chinensis]